MFPRAAVSILIVAAACPLVGQSAGNHCGQLHPELTFEYPADGTKIKYHLSDVGGVSAAWLEVWDRPKRLLRAQVPVQAYGQILWQPEDNYSNVWKTLKLEIFDADIPQFCADYPCGGISFGTHVSEIEAANTWGESIGSADLEGPPIRVEERGDLTDIIATGEDLPADMRVILVERDNTGEQTRWIFREYLNTEAIDFRHVKVTILPTYLRKPTVLGLIGQDASFVMNDKELSTLLPKQEIYVVSKESPMITSLEPSSLRADAKDDDLEVTVRGSGFTKESKVVFGTESAVDMGLDGGDAEFISPQEIRSYIPSYFLMPNGIYVNNERVRVWVTDDDALKISEPKYIEVIPTRPLKIFPKRAAINSITPFPVPLMGAQSSRYEAIEVEGENFRSDDRVVAVLDDERFDLKTEFIADTKMRARLPRELWKKHRLSYRLLLQTAAGVCATEVFEEEDE